MANSTTSSIPTECREIEEFLLNPLKTNGFYVTISLQLCCLIAIGLLFRQFLRHGFPVHGNLLLLFGNIVICTFLTVFSFFLFILRQKILIITYTEPCQLLTPFWMVALGIGPIAYLYKIAHPAFHFCVMLERLRATLRAQKYEQEGYRCGITMVVIIWLLSLAFFAFAVITDYLETNGKPQGITKVTSSMSAQLSVYIMALILAVVLITPICDWRITVLNRRIREKFDAITGYSLSRNYQVQENVFAMRLVLPLDVCHALFYSVHVAGVLTLRARYNTLPVADFDLYAHLNETILLVYSLITLIVYLRFMHYVNCNKRNTNTISANDHAKIYFKQLEAQWNN